jgi:ferredoxin
MPKIHVDMNLCQSHGECVYVAEDLFQLGDDDVLTWQEDIPADRLEDAREAAEVCPMLAIRVEE